MPDIKEKLVELLKRTEYQFTQTHSLTVENVADDLISHGVTIVESNHRAVESNPTNANRIRAMTDEQLEDFLRELADSGHGPWEDPFHEKFCKNCTPQMHKYEDGFEDEVYPCWVDGPGCPHGISNVLWWLQQPAEEVHHE